MYEIDQYNWENGTFGLGRGGFQGARGNAHGGQWYVSHIFDELDAPAEFFYDRTSGVLYLYHNSTASPLDSEILAVTTKVLLSINASQADPVRGISVKGIGFRDTAATYLDPHGVPSGGDWALQRSAAVFLQGTENVTLDSCTFVRLDGNAVMFSGYNRGASIVRSRFNWIGDSAIAAWGITDEVGDEETHGMDGTAGDFPLDTLIAENMAHELGIFEKQSSMWFQAVTAQSHIAGNVNFNMPRAGVNFNDGFGGGDVVEDNMLANCVRESGDHGPFNSWDRVPYITDVADPEKPSIIPAWRHIRHNFFLSLYSSQEAIDTDDGSAYYKTYENFFPYAGNGLKSDFNGHDNRHFRNVYAYVSNCWGGGKNNWFVNNTCVANSDIGGFKKSCGRQETITGNKVYNRNGSLAFDMCNGNTIQKVPDDDELIKMGMDVIGAQRMQASPVIL